jgi:GT2 family glycosyltransferase
VIRIVVVLYRNPVRNVRPLMEIISKSPLRLMSEVCIVRNRDGLVSRATRRSINIRGIACSIYDSPNKLGVAGAYNLIMSISCDQDVLVLLDADAVLPQAFVNAIEENLPSVINERAFLVPNLHCNAIRVSPYRMSGIVPTVVTGELLPGPFLFAEGWGVINSGLVGSVAAFRAVNGFDPKIGLDLSDVYWSKQAARAQASCRLLDVSFAHNLSILSKNFGIRRFRGYSLAAWRLFLKEWDAIGFARLLIRGARAFLSSFR